MTILKGACCLLVFANATAGAQYVERSGISLDPRVVAFAGATPAARVDSVPRGALAIRAFTGALGWIPGGVVGAYLGYNILPHHNCACDDPGLEELVEGFIVGGTLGAAVGAAAPGLNSSCSFGARFGRSLIGSGLGTVVGLLPGNGDSKVIAVPLLSIVGASLAEWRC